MTGTQTVDLASWVTAIWDEDVARLTHPTFCGPVWPTTAELLARIAADRKILELHAQAWDTSKDERAEPYDHCATCWGPWPCATLKALASPYKGREGWQEAWE